MSNLGPEIYLVTDTELDGGFPGLGPGPEMFILFGSCTSIILMIFIMSCMIYGKAHCKNRV